MREPGIGSNVQIFTGRDLRYLLHREGYDPTKARIGNVQNVHNLVTLSGLNIIRDLLGRGAPGTGGGYAPTHVALGSDSTEVDNLDVGLGAENYRDEITVRAGTDLATSSALRIQLYLSLSQGNGLTFEEAGLFDNVTPNVGNMLARVTFQPIAKTGSIELVLTWTIFVQNILFQRST